MVVVTVLDSVMLVSPAALNQRLYRSSVLLLPPVDTGSSQVSVSVVLDIATTLTLSGGDGGTACVWCGLNIDHEYRQGNGHNDCTKNQLHEVSLTHNTMPQRPTTTDL